ncbi:MAG: cytochrome ubiquinol oxidase subunit I [Tepidisphaeraceae bacterium]|jgi:cytochrome d ubiquinol oxidase subunit I
MHNLDVGTLCRIQFAMTAAFHFLFPPITIGLSWLLVLVEWRAWRQKDPIAETAAQFFAKLLALTFAVGVASGVPMEFQFGTNWSSYSKFVGDIFGAPLAAEGVFAFFLESGFLGLYIFGRHRVARKWLFLAICMVAFGATISAFWILVANSWMQTPAGFVIHDGRAELTSFSAAVFNDSMWPRFFHTMFAGFVTGAFYMAGVSAALLLKNRANPIARYTLKLAIVIGLIVSVMEVFPFGHLHARQVARTQPEKFAAIEGLYSSQSKAPLVMFAIPFSAPPTLKAKAEVPGLLSWMAFGDIDAKIKGINDFPADDIPPLWLTFVSFHNMVVLGMYFIFVMSWAALKMSRGILFDSTKFLRLLVISIPLPLAACELGWMAAEVGRQPWAVYHLIRTADAFSSNLSPAMVLSSIIMFAIIYIILGSLYIFLMVQKIHHGPDGNEIAAGPSDPSPVAAEVHS